jgi:hypothetical protein
MAILLWVSKLLTELLKSVEQESLKTTKIFYFPALMKAIIQYIRQYFSDTHTLVLFITSALAGLLIFINYEMGLDASIRSQGSFGSIALSWYFVFLFAFSMPYILYCIIADKDYLANSRFILLLLLAPLLFAIRMSFSSINYSGSGITGFSKLNDYIIYWPASLFFILSGLFFLWYKFDRQQPFYGFVSKKINYGPYWLMLLIMLPLIMFAAAQPDFMTLYPKLNNIEGTTYWWQKILFELAYGCDFITIEIFFRGFLILAFMKCAGKDAILPMALFYCTIHFGKPLAECISSYFGGMLLGIIVYHTRSIYGGLIVHLGIAWMMELAGYIIPLSP